MNPAMMGCGDAGDPAGASDSRSSAGSQGRGAGKPERHKPRPCKPGGKKYCRGCGSHRPLTEFAVNQDLHFECKRAKDALSKMASRRKDAVWFQDVCSDDAKLRNIIAAYRSQSASGTSGKQSRFNFAQYKEVTSSSASAIKDSVGEMMSEEEFIEFSKSIKGGKLSTCRAKLTWDNMVKTKHERTALQLAFESPAHPCQEKKSAKGHGVSHLGTLREITSSTMLV